MESKLLMPMELSEFKRLGPNLPTTQIDIPEKAENRVPTDRPFLFAFAASVILLMPLLIYTLTYADVRRLSGQIDDCGNICGEKNVKYEQWNCTGQDFTNKRNFRMYPSNKCMDDCDLGIGYREESGECITNSTTVVTQMDIGSYMLKGSVIFRLLICSLIAVGASVFVLYIFRYNVGFVLWGMIGTVFVLGVIIVGIMWSNRAYFLANYGDFGLAGCLICTVLLALYVVGVYLLRERIALVIVILTEAAKALFAMPSLVLVSFTTFFKEAVIFTLFLTTAIYMSTSGELVEIEPGRLQYETTGTMATAGLFNVLITAWALMFVGGLQCMVVGGAVSEWYFANDKTRLEQPVKKSAVIALKFHLGTVAFGSLIILLAYLVRKIIQGALKSSFIKKCIEFCLSSMDGMLRCITKKAFIITAMHGQPFLGSGRRAVSLIAYNLGNVVAISVLGRLTLCVGMLLIALISVVMSSLLFIPAAGVKKQNHGDLEAAQLFNMSQITCFC
ncbi:hypothetical protein NQ317_001200 [Molorchus minor]|uniref:Choline transporter-like protein n=1 Tax=Molorchus minor TaxID=1323400 RepID=A0ABQ9JF70_9CUCU|nr:hypothetical protein NQ317_001200 [Molorchus minor]